MSDKPKGVFCRVHSNRHIFMCQISIWTHCAGDATCRRTHPVCHCASALPAGPHSQPPPSPPAAAISYTQKVSIPCKRCHAASDATSRNLTISTIGHHCKMSKCNPPSCICVMNVHNECLMCPCTVHLSFACWTGTHRYEVLSSVSVSSSTWTILSAKLAKRWLFSA